MHIKRCFERQRKKKLKWKKQSFGTFWTVTVKYVSLKMLTYKCSRTFKHISVKDCETVAVSVQSQEYLAGHTTDTGSPSAALRSVVR